MVTYHWDFWITNRCFQRTWGTIISTAAMGCQGLIWEVDWGDPVYELPQTQPQLPDDSGSCHLFQTALFSGLHLWRHTPLPKPGIVLHVCNSSFAPRPHACWDIKLSLNGLPWQTSSLLQHPGGFQPAELPAPCLRNAWEALGALERNHERLSEEFKGTIYLLGETT